MKKYIFGLLATVLISVIGFSQSNSYSTKNNNYDIPNTYYKATMVILVNESQEYYKDGMDFKEFLNETLGGVENVTSNEYQIIFDIYTAHKNNMSSSEIFSQYSGKSLESFVFESSKLNKSTIANSTSVLYEKELKGGKFWRKLAATLQSVADFINEIVDIWDGDPDTGGI